MTIYKTPDGHQRIQSWCTQRLERWEHPHRAWTLDTALGTTHVVTTGDGPDVVLLAGTNFAAVTWLELIAAAASNHTVHAVDLPGQPGLSSPQRPRRPREGYGAWLAGLLPSLAPRGALVVAHSLGAVAALSAAAQGAAVRRLVLLDPAGLVRLSVSPAVLRATLPWLRKPDATTSAGLLRMMLAPGSNPEDHLVGWMALVGRHVRTSLAPAPMSADVLRVVQGLPIDVLSGRHDVFLPPARLERATRRRLDTARVTIVEGAGHLLPHERPDAILHHLTALRASP